MRGQRFRNQEAGPWRRVDVTIDFPLEPIGTDVAALKTIAISGVFSLRSPTGIWVMDIELPQAWSCHPGPQFGIAGTRRLSGVETGPIIASFVKPSLGPLPGKTANVIKQLRDAGIEFIGTMKG